MKAATYSGVRLSCLIAIALLSLAALRSNARAADTPEVVVLKAGDTILTGLCLSAEGVLVAPAGAGGDITGWTASVEGETYPVKKLAAAADYGLVFFKIDRQKPFNTVALVQKQAPSGARLQLAGVDSAGKPTTASATLLDKRLHGISELHLTGSYYELKTGDNCPRDGAALIDADTGVVYGILVSAKGDAGERYALFGTDIAARATSVIDTKTPGGGITLNPGGANSGPKIEFMDGHSVLVQMRQFGFESNLASTRDARTVREVQDLRIHSGWWLSALTSPFIGSDHSYFGSTSGLLYSIDLKTLQREWAYKNEIPIFFEPAVGDDLICFSSGALHLQALQEHDSTLVQLAEKFGSRVKIDTSTLNGNLKQDYRINTMMDEGQIVCIDRKSGNFRWVHLTRFPGKPCIIEDKVAFGGLDSLGVLNLADGKVVWANEPDRDSGSPDFYTVAGGTHERMWVLAVNTHKVGGSGKDPLHLVQGSRKVNILCYNTFDGRRSLWQRSLDNVANSPALTPSIILTPDYKQLYVATARDIACIDADTGKKLWQEKVFTGQFSGSLICADGFVYANSYDDKTNQSRLYAVDAASGHLIWTFDESKQPLCVPLEQGSIVYIGSLDGSLYALDSRTGRKIWKFQTGGKVCGQPRVVGNRLYCMSDDGRMSEIELPR